MSSQQVYSYLKKHKGTAFTLRVLKNKLKTPNLWKKLGQLEKYGMINTISGIIDYPHHKNIKVTYYHIGNIKKYVPRPKQVMLV